MKNKLPCELIQDLFPSYIDGLTSEITNTMVEEHVDECQKCKNILEIMREPSPKPMDSSDRKEIDFLKKNRKKNQNIIIGSIIASFLIIVVVLFIRIFMIGNDVYGEMVVCEVKVNGKHASLSGVIADSSLGISDIEYKEEKGVLTVSFQAVKKSFLYDGKFQSDYEAKQEITQVCIGDRIIWAQGEKISSITSAVYRTRHAYIGDMSKNGRTAAVLNMQNYLGEYTNELQTKKEPYGWKFVLKEDSTISSEQRRNKESRMKLYGYVLLAVIENLGEVSYEYNINGEACSISVNTEEASDFAGVDIKKCGQDILLLQELMEKTGLNDYAYVTEDSWQQMQEELQIEIVNNADDIISGMTLKYSAGSKECGTVCTVNADGSSIIKGDTLYFSFIPDDFGGKEWTGEMDMKLEASVQDKDGNTYNLKEPFHIQAERGGDYRYILSGNAEDGYVISQ